MDTNGTVNDAKLSEYLVEIHRLTAVAEQLTKEARSHSAQAEKLQKLYDDRKANLEHAAKTSALAVAASETETK